MTLRQLPQLESLLHYLRRTLPRLPEKLPTRNVNLRHTGLFVQSVPMPDMRVYVRLVLPRFVSSQSFVLLQLNDSLLLQKDEEVAAKKK